MTETRDVVVIGGGIAGCSTAYYLAADGVPVTLLEQFEPGALASGSNAGSLHAQIQPEPFLTRGEAWARAFALALPLYAESIALWQQAGERVGADFEVSLNGGLVVAADGSEMRMLEAKARLDRAAGLEMDLLDSSDLRERLPCVSKRMVGGVLCPIEGKANPLVAAPAFARAAEALGTTVQTRCRVTSIRRNGGLFDIDTTRGSYRTARLVNAAGAEAGPVARLAGSSLEYEPYVQQLLVTEPAAPLIDCLIYAAGERLTLKQTGNGTLVIGGGWPAATGDGAFPQVLSTSLSANLRVACEVVPALRTLRITRTWAAAVNGNASWLPLIGPVPGVPGLFMNWVPWMGFSGALAASRILASLVQERKPPIDFDISCFAP